MKLSIIIPSYKRPELLNAGLYSLSQLKTIHPYEIIVCNDGREDNTEHVCRKYQRKLKIRYFFTGQRNDKKLIWRVPGFALNIGVSKAKGEFIILTSPEIFVLDNCLDEIISILNKNKKALVIPEGMHDASGEILKKFNDTGIITKNDYNNKRNTVLDTNLPFFMGLSKNEFNKINGYNEDFTGYCFDDADVVDRLLYNDCEYYQISAKIIHLYHQRGNREGLADKATAWQFNKTLYENNKINRKIEVKDKIIDKIKKVFKSKEIEKKKEEIEVNEKEYKFVEKTDAPSLNKWELIKVPKIAHFYWGEDYLPYLRYLTIFTFHKYNPDWEIRFYYPKYRYKGISWNSSEHCFKFSGKDYYNKLKALPIKLIEVDFELLGFSNDISEVYKANYLEYHILNKIGGLFSDTDIIYFNSINAISLNTKKNSQIDNIFSILWHGHTMGFLLSSPDNEIYNYILKKIKIYLKKLKGNYQCIGTLMINREIGNTINNISKKFSTLNIQNLNPKALYAYDIKRIKEIYDFTNNLLFTKGSIGLHWYGGYSLSMEYLNKINKPKDIITCNIIDNTIRKSLDIEPKICPDLTIHAVVKNEPFIYYSIKSVYNYAKKILLYDTGSNDKYTIKDIKQLLKEDKEHKIIYKQIPLDFDETKWTYEKVNEFAKKHQGKMSVGKVRQMQLDDTNTEYCMIVDGDEVHYKSTMEKIVNDILPNLDKNIIGINIPLTWFYNQNNTFIVPDLENTGRIWRVSKVKMNEQSPNEYHCFKDTGIPIARTDKEYLIYKDLTPYAHFETFLKPWRRKINKSQLIQYKDKLPEVIEEYPTFLNRYIKESKGLK